jgi:hypothetical protein
MSDRQGGNCSRDAAALFHAPATSNAFIKNLASNTHKHQLLQQQLRWTAPALIAWPHCFAKLTAQVQACC